MVALLSRSTTSRMVGAGGWVVAVKVERCLLAVVTMLRKMPARMMLICFAMLSCVFYFWMNGSHFYPANGETDNRK